MTSMHLTDEQFTGLLTGDCAETRLYTHLESCPDCRAEFDRVQPAIESFNEVGLLWAEARAPRRVPVPSIWTLRFQGVSRWSMAAAAMLILGTAIGVHQERRAPMPVQTDLATTSAPSTTVLAEDNRLMVSIDQELSSDVRPQVPVTELQETSTASNQNLPKRFEN
jgi:hypothetical protein